MPVAPRAPRPGRVFFIRHGETAWNREGRLQGQRDVALNPLGRRQAETSGVTLGRLLIDRGLDPAGSRFVCSPLARARDTMDIVRTSLSEAAWASPRNVARFHDRAKQDRVGRPTQSCSGEGLPPVAYDERLREMSFGAWEGRTWEDIKLAEPAAVAERRRACWWFVPPGGESYAMLLERLSPWLADLAPDAIVVAHGGVARALMHELADVGTERATTEPIHQGRVLLFEGGASRWI